MSIFKKPEKGFLAKLFKHKQVEELAEELAHTYADEMQADTLSDNPETDTAEDTAAEPVPMLEVTETGEVDFTEPPETTEGESPPQDSADSAEPSEVRNTKLLEENTEQAEKIKDMLPKASYYDYVLSAEGLMPINTIAKDYGKSGLWQVCDLAE